MNIKLAQIQAKRQAESRDAELQRDVETKRAEVRNKTRSLRNIDEADKIPDGVGEVQGHRSCEGQDCPGIGTTSS